MGSGKPRQMAQMRLQLLGGFRLFDRAGEVVQLRSRKLRGLIAYLVLNPDHHHEREKLANLLWGDRLDVQARQSLRQALWTLRKRLGNTGTVFVQADDQTVWISEMAVVVDVAHFERFAREGRLDDAVTAYGGDLLEGLSIRSEPFESWLAQERTRLRTLAGDVWERLSARRLETGDVDGAIESAKQLVAMEPFREPGHRILMRAYATVGRRTEAVKQYTLLAKMLRQELNSEPDLDTTHLHEEIRATQNAASTATADNVRSAVTPDQLQETSHRDRPSIAVLPFDNLSGDPEQEYFADGIVDDLITALSRMRWLLVTARNSTFSYKGQSPDVRDVGRQLGVRYVLEGSVRKGGNRVRISAQLVDASTGNHIWAERYDRDLSDIFELQDEVCETLVAAVQGEVGDFERERAHRKAPDNLDAWDSYQRGMWHLSPVNARDLSEARQLFQRAADLDPEFAQPFAALGYTLFLEVIYSYTDTPFENLDQALQSANKAVALDDKEAMAHFALGRIQTLRGQYDAAISALRTAIELNPSMALAHYGLAFALWLTEQLNEAVSQCDTAIRLSPRDPVAWAYYTLRSWTHFSLGDYEAVLEDARHSIQHPAATYWAHTTLAPALALLDKREEAKVALDKLLEFNPDFTVNAVLAALSPLNPDALRPRFNVWIDGLRKAGLDVADEPALDD